MSASSILVEISPGELIDKITILAIKSQRMTDPAKLKNVELELEALTGARDRALSPSPALERLTAQLQRVNELLWETEDEIRDCERSRQFGLPFIELARKVYITNDERSALKRQINELLGSRIIEEKNYASY